jgi:hypothetical protein
MTLQFDFREDWIEGEFSSILGLAVSLIAVGTVFLTAPRTDPYVRSYRIRFLPWMLTCKPHARIGVEDLRSR